MPLGYRVVKDDQFTLRTISSIALQVSCDFVVEYDDGGVAHFPLQVTAESNRTIAAVTTRGRVSRPGMLISANAQASGAKRGQLYCQLRIASASTFGENRQWVGRGYIYDEHSVTMGDFHEAGPGSGNGFLDWEQIADDVSGNVVTTTALAVTNTRRIVRGLLLKYHADSNVATRNVVITLRDVADTSGPTGFTIDEDVWESTTLALTQDQEGLVYINAGSGQGPSYHSINDAGTISILNNASANTPFPLSVEEGDTGDIVIQAENGVAGDDYDAFLLVEEWSVP